MIQRRGIFVTLSLLLVLATACSRDGSAGAGDRVDKAGTGAAAPAQFTNLGLLGAMGCGAPGAIEVPELPGREDAVGGAPRHCGGVVLHNLDAGSPLAALGLQPQDVLIAVMENFLPNKENPCFDLLARIESALTAGATAVELVYLRDGATRTALLELTAADYPPLGQGDLRRSERYAVAAQRGLEYLRSVQDDGGCFPVSNSTADARLAAASLAGLAFLAGRDLEDAERFQESRARCRDAVEDAIEAGEVGHLGSSFAIFFLAETSRNNPTDLSTMTLLARALGAVLEAQRDDGGWALAGACGQEETDASATTATAAATTGFNERTLATHLCLAALGVAERAGVQMENAPIEQASAFLRKHTNEGRVGFLPHEEFDRRSEAGRLAGILVAMRAISCAFNDIYLQKLFAYYADHAHEIAWAPLDESIHLLSSALLARQKGLLQWNRFNHDNQILLLSLQKLDGSFVTLPKARRVAVPFFDDLQGPAWRTALYSLILLLQEDTLPLLTAKVDGTQGKRRDSEGTILAGPEDADSSGEQPPEQAGTMMFTNIDDAIEAMKKMGLDEDSPEMKQLMELKEQMGDDE